MELCLSLPFQRPYFLFTDCPVFEQSLSTKYGMYIHRCTETKTGISLSVLKATGKYRFTSPHKDILTDCPLYELDRYLFEHADYDPCILALHGAAVEWKGGGYLFLAATQSGKTTLTSYLTSWGFGFLTDDCILLDRKDFRIYPNAEPIHLREGGLAVLKKYGAVPPDLRAVGEDPSLLRYVYTPPKIAAEAVPLRCIYFPERTEEENSVTSMTANERLVSLMKSPIISYSVTGDYLRLLSRLARVRCYRLRYKDMDYVKERIQNESNLTE